MQGYSIEPRTRKYINRYGFFFICKKIKKTINRYSVSIGTALKTTSKKYSIKQVHF